MEDKKILLDNIDKIHTTEMGIDRIKRNVTVQHPVKGTLIFGQNRENKISVSSLL